MRDILFRGKTEGLSSWIYGVPISFADGIMWLMTATDYNGFGVGINYVEVKSGTVGQWTGLTDRHGTKIFEGDIVEAINTRFVVKFGRCGGLKGEPIPGGYLGFYLHCVDKEIACVRNDILFWHEEYEAVVVGNVYDDPELLKGASEE